MVNAIPTKPVVVVIFTPAALTYKSLRERVVTLADPNQITEVAHAFTIADCRQLIQKFVEQRMFLCCEVADGREDSGEEIQEFFMDLWHKPQQLPPKWISTRPLLGMSEDQEVVDDMQKIARRFPRQYGEIVNSIPIVGRNRWRDTKDALLRGMQNA